MTAHTSRSPIGQGPSPAGLGIAADHHGRRIRAAIADALAAGAPAGLLIDHIAPALLGHSLGGDADRRLAADLKTLLANAQEA